MPNQAQKLIRSVLQKYTWKEEETPANILIVDIFKTCYQEANTVYGRKLFTKLIYFVGADGYTYEWVPSEEMRTGLAWVKQKHLKNPSYFPKLLKKFILARNKMDHDFISLQHRDLSKLSNAQLTQLIIKLDKILRRTYSYAIIPEVLDILTETDYAQLLPQVPENKQLEVLHILTTPNQLTFSERERLSLLKIKQNYSLVKLEAHTQNFYWLRNSFARAIHLTSSDFQKSLKKIKFSSSELKALPQKPARNQRLINQVEKKYRLKLEQKSFFQLIRIFAYLQDQRKECVLKLMAAIDKIQIEISRRCRLPKSEFYQYLISDLIQLLKTGRKISRSELKSRQPFLFFTQTKNQTNHTSFFRGTDAQNLSAYFQAVKQQHRQQQLKGFVASKGKQGKIISGRVHLVIKPEGSNFKTGEILVTGMTRPEFVPLMKKAKAVITNEGGITTHAAIISRELGIPCLIGTKFATQILKNNDIITINLTTGVITKKQ